MLQVLGRQHPTIRRLRVLRTDATRRRAESVLVAEGIHLAQEALAAARDSIELVLLSPELSGSEEGRRLLARIRESEVPCFETSDSVIQTLQDARSAQPILTLLGRPSWPRDGGLSTASRNPLVGVAHGIQDPGNLGSLLRTLHAAGGTACFVDGAGADPFHPRAVRASMGSILRLPVFVEPTEQLLPRLRERRIALVGADASGEQDYSDCNMSRALAVFFGSEGRGLPPALLSELDETVRVPLHSGVESLSVGAAAAVLLFEAARQRRASA